MNDEKTNWPAIVAICFAVAGAVAMLCLMPRPQTHDANAPLVKQQVVAVFFSPGKTCEDEIIAEIGKAKKEILVQAYDFTSQPIADALVKVHKRGIAVKLEIDHKASENKSCKAPDLIDAGIPVWTDARHPIAHAKIMVIDAKVVICGSYNFSKNAVRNSEDLVVLHDAKLAREFKANWDRHLDHCVRLLLMGK